MNFAAFVLTFSITASLLLGAAVTGWRSIDSPAVDLFAVVSGTAGLGGLCLAAGFATESFLLILGTTIVIALLVPVPWVLFVFDYVGQESLVSAWVAALLSVPVLAGLSATMALYVGAVVPNFTLGVQADLTGVLAVIATVLQLTQWGALLYAGGLVFVGAGLILWTFQRYGHLDSTTGIALCTFGAISWLTILFGLQLEPISFLAFGMMVAIGYVFQALAAVALVGPPGLFGRVPAAGNVGPATIIQELDDPVVVTDRDGQVVELNPAVRQELGWSERAVGSTLEQSLGTALADLRKRQIVEIESDAGRVLFEPTVSDLTDQHGHLLGYAIVFRNVTERRTRRQRLEVLNRILRHNLRNDLTVILGYANVIRSHVDDPTVVDGADRITDTSERLVNISEKAHKSTKLLETDANPDELTQLEPAVTALFAELRSESDAEFTYESNAAVGVPVPPEQLNLILRSLTEHILDNNDREQPVFELRASYDPDRRYPLDISFIDNGAGVLEAERKVIETGTETPLEHTKGVDLWTARWLTTGFGGDISFHEGTSGVTVMLSFPTATILAEETQ